MQQARGPVDASVFVSLARHLSDPGRVRGTGMQCLVADRPLIFIRLETLGGGVTFPSFSVSRSCAILFRMYPFRRMWRLSSLAAFSERRPPAHPFVPLRFLRDAAGGGAAPARSRSGRERPAAFPPAGT